MALTVTSAPWQQVNMPALDLRRYLSAGRQEGVVGSGDMAVVQRGAGANFSVDIAAGEAVIQGDTVANQGRYYVLNDATFNLTGFTTANATNPRIDRVTLRVRDAFHGDAANDVSFQIVTGTATAGATLANLNGAAAVPASSVLLANILIPATATTITTANIDTTAAVRPVGVLAPSALSRQGATDGQGMVYSAASGWGPGAVSAGAVPISLRNPQTAANAGNCFPTVTALTAWEEWHWEFVKDVDGKLFGIVKIGAAATTAAKIVLSTLYNATTGVSRWSVSWASAADAASLDPGTLTSITSQDVTVPGTARLRKDVTFTLGSQPAANDIVIVQIFHEGAHANDTVAVNSELLGAWLLPS